MHKLLEVPRRNFARARLTISLARTSPTKGVILVVGEKLWSVAPSSTPLGIFVKDDMLADSLKLSFVKNRKLANVYWIRL